MVYCRNKNVTIYKLRNLNQTAELCFLKNSINILIIVHNSGESHFFYYMLKKCSFNL